MQAITAPDSAWRGRGRLFTAIAGDPAEGIASDFFAEV